MHAKPRLNSCRFRVLSVLFPVLLIKKKKVFRDIRGTLLRGRALLEEEQRGEGKGWLAGDSDCQCEVRSASPPRERASNYPARAGSTELSLVLVP